MQSNGKNLSEFLQGNDIPALMAELGFECFQTAMMCSGMKCIVYQKIQDPGNQWKIEVGTDCKIQCWDWNEDGERWGFRFGCEINPGFIDNLQHWILILHLAGAISIPKLLKLVNENLSDPGKALLNLCNHAINEASKVSNSLCSSAQGISGPCPAINTVKMVEA